MNKGSTLKNFANLALFFSSLACCVGAFHPALCKSPEGPCGVLIDSCGIAKFVTNNRMQIDFPYHNNLDCRVVLNSLDYNNYVDITLTIDNFKVSVINYLRFLKRLILCFLCSSPNVHMTGSKLK